MRDNPVGRGAAALVGCAALVVGIAACGGADSGDESGPVELQFLGAEPVESFAPAIEAFEQAHPDIRVVYNSVPFAQFNSTLQARMTAQDASLDVYMADEPRIPFLGSRQYLVPWPGDAATLDQTLNPNDIEAVTWNDQVWALPLWTSSQLLYYNRELLDAAGIEPPSADPAQRLTWEGLVEAAAAAQAAGATWGFSFQQVDRYYQLQTLPESLGGGPGLTGDDLLTPALTEPGWIAAMEWYHSIFADGVSPRGIEPGQIPDLFANGELAYMVGTPVYVSRFAETEGLQWGVAPQPRFADGEAYTPTDGWALGVSPYSEQQAAAWEFVEYLTLDPAGSATTIAGRPFPSANTATQQEYLALLPELAGGNAPEISELLSHELTTTAIHRPRTIGYVPFEEVMNKAFADIRNGADPAERLRQAEQELASAFERLPRN
jgi:multiple sugar transport system substrate-binding protein